MDDSFVEETDGFGDQFFGHKKKHVSGNPILGGSNVMQICGLTRPY